MKSGHFVLGLLAIGGGVLSAPASAQFYFQNPVITGEPVIGNEPGIAIPLPGASPAELRAGLGWSLRAALNLAALQCQFEPTLLTVPNYNAVLLNHSAELKASFDTLGKYFARTAKTRAAGQGALDRFGTRVYSSFSVVAAQFDFCLTASEIGYEALIAKRGEFSTLSMNRMRQMRNALVPRGEQRFPGRVSVQIDVPMPRFDPGCWDRRNRYNFQRCGVVY